LPYRKIDDNGDIHDVIWPASTEEKESGDTLDVNNPQNQIIIVQ